jgi:hypothetical protein
MVAEARQLVNAVLEVQEKALSDMAAILSTARGSRRPPGVHPLHVESYDKGRTSCKPFGSQ